ncbi:hypothetical protein [Ramlibacter sp. WS9]|uniref:hypothetical protein n=1 Tax=Ramlibacter sp. WS9 TaxID=1882741 RepID=UPI0013051514|nr:hypothetical protein [Ramlibacter sp. WS9]
MEFATPDVSLELPPAVLPEPDVEPEAPIELVLPLPEGEPLALVLPDVSLPAAVEPLVLPPAVLPPAGVLVLDELVEVDGVVAASSRLVQAPRETAATSASAAHVVRDAFIGKLLGDC